MKTAEGLALFAERVYNEEWLYAWGMFGQRLADVYSRLANSTYYRDKNPSGLARLKEVLDSGANPRVCDCHGIKDGYMMTNDDTGALEPRSGVDTSADYDFNRVVSYGKEGVDWGTIDTMPTINQRGLGVRKPGHFGVMVSATESIDIYSTASPARRIGYRYVHWTHWFKCDGINYGTTGGSVMAILKTGSTGEAVKALQANLNTLIGAGLIVDGDYGPKTATAVSNFQRQYGLTVDGIAGDQTFAMIDKLLTPAPAPTVDYKPALDAANIQIDNLEEQLEAVKKALADMQGCQAQADRYKALLGDVAAAQRVMDQVKTTY